MRDDELNSWNKKQLIQHILNTEERLHQFQTMLDDSVRMFDEKALELSQAEDLIFNQNNEIIDKALQIKELKIDYALYEACKIEMNRLYRQEEKSKRIIFEESLSVFDKIQELQKILK